MRLATFRVLRGGVASVSQCEYFEGSGQCSRVLHIGQWHAITAYICILYLHIFAMSLGVSHLMACETLWRASRASLLPEDPEGITHRHTNAQQTPSFTKLCKADRSSVNFWRQKPFYQGLECRSGIHWPEGCRLTAAIIDVKPVPYLELKQKHPDKVIRNSGNVGSSREQRFFLRCRELVTSAVPTFAAKAFLLCFAGSRSRAKPQAKAPINQARFFLRRLFA